MSAFNLQQVNSTTYVDQLAIQLGMFQDRLPGESAPAFLGRLYQAAYSRRDRSCEGVVNDIAARLGLKVESGITITFTDPTTVVSVEVGRVSIAAGTHTTYIPTATIDPDGFWAWRMLSDVVADLNAQPGCTAVLNIADALAFRIVPQSSRGCSVAEPCGSIVSNLEHGGVVVGSEVFNHVVPSYTLTSAGKLTFTAAPSSDTTVSYLYNLSPFTLTCSEASVLRLSDPALASTAVCLDGSLVYQLREYLNAVLSIDSSYWGV